MILDVDTGIDDAFALALAARHPRVNLLGVTCVDGNAPLEDVVRNTRTVLEATGRPDVPVVAGAHRPLLAPPHYAPTVHGQDGFGDIDWPAATGTAREGHAVTWLAETILGSEQPVTLVTLAPLTNIAMLVRMAPEVGRNIERVVIMGGSASAGNVSALAEFNVHHDPEAAAIVFASGLPITMYGLDVFTQVTVPEQVIREMATSDLAITALMGRLGIFLGDALGFPLGIGDAGAVCAAIEPAGLETQRLLTSVVTHPGAARGMTAVDQRPYVLDGEHALDGHPVEVALGVDAQSYARMWLDHVRE